MCRNIKKLRYPDHPPSDAELHDAALQFIRKISGFRVPSQANQEAFETAVDDVAAASRKMFGSLIVKAARPETTSEHEHDHPHSHDHPHAHPHSHSHSHSH